MSSLKEAVLDLFIPKCCLFCGDVLYNNEELICSECLARYEAKRENTDDDFPKYYAFYYDEYVKDMIYDFKFGGRPEYAEFMGRLMFSYAERNGIDLNFDAVTFVPMPCERKRMRGYNQAELIAKAFGKEAGIEVKAFGLRRESAIAQHDMSGDMRRKHKNDYFIEDGAESPENKSVLIVDDLITTGETVRKCGELLREKGAVKLAAFGFGGEL